MKKQFKVPANTKVQITRENNRVVIEFVPEKVEFKDGDFLTDISEDVAFIYRNDGSDRLSYYIDFDGKINFTSYWSLVGDPNVRLSTDSEKQQLIDILAEKGLFWNAEEKKVKKIRWRAEDYRNYYYIDDDFSVDSTYDSDDGSDRARYNSNNYFKTEDQANEAARLVKETLLNFQESL